MSVPRLVLVGPASETSLTIQLESVGQLPPNSYIRIQGLPPTVALTDGHAIAAGSWAVPLAALEDLRMIVPAGLSGRSEVTVSLVAIDGGVVASDKFSLVVAVASVPVRETDPIEKRSAAGSGASNGAAAKSMEAPKREATAPPPAKRPPPVEAPKAEPAARARAQKSLPPASSLGAGHLPSQSTPRATEKIEPPKPPSAQSAAPARAAAIPPPAAAAPADVKPPPRLSPGDKARADDLLRRGQAKLAEGNVALARLFFERAADIGLAEAAMAMGETYDAFELDRRGAVGIQADPEEARRWYEKARELGAGDAAVRLIQRLGKR